MTDREGRKIKMLVKRVDEQVGHMAIVSDKLENLQGQVGGYLEAVTLRQGLVMLVDEEGLIKEKPYNCRVDGIPVFGDLLIVGAAGDEFSDIPITMSEWKERWLSDSAAATKKEG